MAEKLPKIDLNIIRQKLWKEKENKVQISLKSKEQKKQKEEQQLRDKLRNEITQSIKKKKIFFRDKIIALQFKKLKFPNQTSCERLLRKRRKDSYTLEKLKLQHDLTETIYEDIRLPNKSFQTVSSPQSNYSSQKRWNVHLYNPYGFNIPKRQVNLSTIYI